MERGGDKGGFENVPATPGGNWPGGAPGMPGNGGGAPGAASTGSVSSRRPLSSSPLRLAGREGDNVPPGNAGKPGGGKAPLAPGWFCGSIGLLWAWPSAAYELVMESMTDWAFSWPISAVAVMSAQAQAAGGYAGVPAGPKEGLTHAGSSRRRCGCGFGRCCEPCARSWSRA